MMLTSWKVAALLVFVSLLTSRALLAATKTCEDLLDNNVYTCNVKTSFSSEFTDCFRFTNPGTSSLHFDLSTDGLGQTLGCACRPKGSFKKPRFDASKEFFCESNAGDTLGISFMGKPQAKGKKIKKGEAVNQFGDTFLFDCQLDPFCGAAGIRGSGARKDWSQ